MLSASRWPTKLGISQYRTATGAAKFPDYLLKDVENDTTVNVYANGEMNYTINGIHAKVSVGWNFQAPEVTGVTPYSIMSTEQRRVGKECERRCRYGGSPNIKKKK